MPVSILMVKYVHLLGNDSRSPSVVQAFHVEWQGTFESLALSSVKKKTDKTDLMY